MRQIVVLFLLLSFPAAAETVRIDGPQGPLAAELSAAKDARHIVVIVPGSGPIDRDGNSGGVGIRSDAYKLLAVALAKNGISSLRIDKRGLFGSATAISDPNDVTIAAYADDVRNWVRMASRHADCVWIAGHSEGGLVALVAAQKAPEALCGLVLLAAPGRPVGRLLIEQSWANPANGPLMPEIESIVADLEVGRTRNLAAISPVLRTLFSAGLQRYMTDLFAYDPVTIAGRWKGAALILQGDADIQVKLQDARLLAAAMPQARRVDLKGATHMLKDDTPGQPFRSYRDPGQPLHRDLVPAILDLLKNHPPRR